MIGYLKGTIEEKAPDHVVIDVGGVGYVVQVPLSTFYELGDRGEEVALRIHTHVRDDAIQLYGFARRRDQALFEKLIGVAGIGPKLAVTILSGMEVDDLLVAISARDVARLSTIPGGGKKTAERLSLELEDKVADLAPAAIAAPLPRGVRDDVLSALRNLGYRDRAAERAVASIDGDLPFEELLRQALRTLAR
jgi:Holliday junction DNA helicase RuvA